MVGRAAPGRVPYQPGKQASYRGLRPCRAPRRSRGRPRSNAGPAGASRPPAAGAGTGAAPPAGRSGKLRRPRAERGSGRGAGRRPRCRPGRAPRRSTRRSHCRLPRPRASAARRSAGAAHGARGRAGVAAGVASSPQSARAPGALSANLQGSCAPIRLGAQIRGVQSPLTFLRPSPVPLPAFLDAARRVAIRQPVQPGPRKVEQPIGTPADLGRKVSER